VSVVHPIERLRYVARAGWAEPGVLASEAAWALGDLALHEEAALVPACRRLLDRHPGCGPLWWVAARVLTAGDPVDEAERCADALDTDPTAELLEEELSAVTRSVRHGGVGDVAGAEVVVIEVEAIGPGGMVVDPDDAGLIEAARSVEVPLWVQAGVGRVMPGGIWEAMARRVGASHIRRTGAVVTLDGVDRVAGADGLQTLPTALAGGGCPEPAALLARW
jgi:hypothetical protein